MKCAVLFSGGKDSCLALYYAQKEGYTISCLVTMQSSNKESYMFHTPNATKTSLQAQALGIPLIEQETRGEKETELNDLKAAIQKAKDVYQVDAIITGAVRSTYQASRIQKICYELGLHCFNPLWQLPQITLLKQLVDFNFEVIIVGVFAYPLTQAWLGRVIDDNTITELQELHTQYKLHPAGEGGEIETFVTDGPMFNKKIIIKEQHITYENYAGELAIQNIVLEDKS